MANKPAKIAFRNQAEAQAAQESARLANFVVVQADDARIAKYPHPHGSSGFSLESAQLKALPAHPEQPAYKIISVAQYEMIAGYPEALTPQQAVSLFAREAQAA